MALTQLTLAANAVTPITIDAPTGRIVVTFITAGTIYYTLDTSTPVIPSNDVEIVGTQQVLAGLAGQQCVIQPRLFGDHMAIPTLLVLSAATPAVAFEW